MINLVPIKQLFTPVYGVNLELVHLEECKKNDLNSVRFISRTEQNNGISAYVKKVDDIVPNPANTISVAVSGSVLASFYQDDEYYSGRDLYYLYPERTMRKEEMLFYAYCIKLNKYKYNYGRAANKTLKDILIPAEMPMGFQNISLTNKRLLQDHSTLNSGDYQSFQIAETKTTPLIELFTVEYGNSLELINLIQCKSTDNNAIPFISRTEKNNGVSAYVEKELDIDVNPVHTLSVAVGGSVLSTFYQPLPYYTGFHVLVLTPKHEMSVVEMLFYAQYIRANKYKYNYGRQANKTLKDILIPIKIPIDTKNHFHSFYHRLLNSISSTPLINRGG
ncbi:MAG: restriction endonuclease subunit S [Nitrospirae bacterium]|nr:restriction endonuclease subunit S [Nitrospirota bacterium]